MLRNLSCLLVYIFAKKNIQYLLLRELNLGVLRQKYEVVYL
jgi:hypothetical protein